MTVTELKKMITGSLAEHVGAAEAEAMCREIVRYLLGYEPVDAVINGAREILPQTAERASAIVARVVAGEPLQYVLGSAWFMGMELSVSPAVLIPRPETSQLVDIITDQWRGRSDLRVLDIGTGSGCIAIALARALPFAQVDATDVSAAALEVAAANARALKARVSLRLEDITTAEPQESSYGIIVSNPPYIAMRERAGMDARVYDHEPSGALFVPDADPLVFYRAIARYAATALAHDGALYFEINPLFVTQLRAMLGAEGFSHVDIQRDYKGNLRFAVCRR